MKEVNVLEFLFVSPGLINALIFTVADYYILSDISISDIRPQI